MWLFLAAAVGLAGGFYFGKHEGEKPVHIHKALSSALRNELKEAHQEIEELKLRCDRPDGASPVVPTHSRDTVPAWNPMIEDRYTEPVFGPVFADSPEHSDFEFLTRQRIDELECEIAALKETINQPAGTPGETAVSQTESKQAREQCAALTKKGTRCTRPARSDGKCWQHGG